MAGRCREWAEPKPWQRLRAALRAKEWVGYAKEPLENPRHVLKYLARSTHRVAISTHRLVALHDGQVACRFKVDKRRGQLRTQTLDAGAFLRRVGLHGLPRGLHPIRSFGFLATCHRQAQLAHCRTLLGQPAAPLRPSEMALNENGPDQEEARAWGEPRALGPVCHQGRMQLVQTYDRYQAAWDLSLAVPAWDPS